MFSRKLLSAALVGAALIAAPASAAQLTNPTTTSQLVTNGGGLRLRALATTGDQEAYLGRHDLGSPAGRVGQNLVWNQNGANNFSLSFDAGTDTLSAVINSNPTLNFGNFLAGLNANAAGQAFNMLQIQLRDGGVGAGTLSLSNLMLNGAALTPSALAATEGQLTYWGVYGDFKQSFTLTGTLNLAGTFPTSSELNRVEFLVGSQAVPEPATWAMMIGGFGMIGGAMRRRAKVNVAFA